jgi:hypothetical protein
VEGPLQGLWGLTNLIECGLPPQSKA